MNGRTKSYSALESADGNWVISSSRANEQAFYSIPQRRPHREIFLTENSRTPVMSTNGVKTFERPEIHFNKIDGHRAINDYTRKRQRNKNYRSRNLQRMDARTRIKSHSNEQLASRNIIRRNPIPHEVVLCKSDGGFGFTMRQISSSMYGNNPETGFVPTPRVPALQRLNVIDPGSLADRAGLHSGDYIIEINDENVTCYPHLHVVQLIKNSPNALKLKVMEGFNMDYETSRFQTISSSRGNQDQYKNKTDFIQNSSLLRNGTKPRYREQQSRATKTVVEVGTQNESPVSVNSSSSSGHLSSNGSLINNTLNRNAQLQQPKQPTVANIRLSRYADRDKVYYLSNEKEKWRNTRDSHSATPDFRVRMTSASMPSNSSTLSLQSFPTGPTKRNKRHGEGKRIFSDEKNPVNLKNSIYERNINVTSEINRNSEINQNPEISRNAEIYMDGDINRNGEIVLSDYMNHNDIINDGNKINQNMKINDQNEENNQNESQTDDVNHTYDTVRPRNVPFDTDEGYIRLSENIDYVTELDKEQEKVNFLEMAERVRQMFLRSKSVIQATQ